MAKTLQPKASAAPGTQEPKAKKEKKERIAYPIPEGGLERFPEDYDRKTHKPLKRSDFKDEALFYDLRAEALERQAKALRTEAENVRKLGGVKDRAKAKRLLKMQSQMAELQEELKGQGVDIAALMATLSANGDKA